MRFGRVPAGYVPLAILIGAASQLGLFLAPLAAGRGQARRIVVGLLMLPAAAVVALALLDRALLLVTGLSAPWLPAAVLGWGVLVYALAYVQLFGERLAAWATLKRAWLAAGLTLGPVLILAALFVGNIVFHSWSRPGYATTAVAPLTGPVTELRVVAFNLAKAYAYRGRLRFSTAEQVRRRLDEAASAINAERPHLVFLSEVNVESGPCPVDQVAYLARKTGMHAYAFGENYNWGLPFYRIRSGNALLSRLPLRAVETMQLRGAWPVLWPVGNRRVLWADVQVNGRWLLAGSIRNDSYDLRNNARQVEQILDYVGGRPALLAGDFNATSKDPPIRRLRQAGQFCGAFDGPPTFHAAHPTECLDFIFAPAAWRLVEHRVPECRASDHRPVFSSFALPRP